MASILVLKGARAGRSLKQSKRDTFKEEFKSEVILNGSSSGVAKPGQVLEGTIRIENNRTLEHWGESISI